ncbi:hypothetical protein Taro_016279 [Colocasia esculenta]|uniref:MORF/ORRM1/DAG-like MORF domain-containing protein n=1 Tax=Colocasia esculenta TaxID=4460 RepID=A0A843UPN8_COLES|nr:hypothetical protein [Colocasia esculenta]
MAVRTLISRTSWSITSLSPAISARSFASKCASRQVAAHAAPLRRLRTLASAVGGVRGPSGLVRREGAAKCFSTRPTTSSLNDPSPNWSNRPPKETILLDGCDFEHWLVVMEPPEGETTRDDIIDSYIKTLAQVVGSEDEARMKIYSVSTKHYFAFGALVSEELSYKIKALPKVRWVLPDSYLDVKNKDYGGEPFIDGKAVPYDPKYHEEWVRNNARANERSRRNDRPRNFDRSRNFERRRENMQNRDFQNRSPGPMPDFQNRGPGPMPNQQFQNSEAQNPMPPRDVTPGPGTHANMPPVPPPGSMPSGPGMPNPSFQGAPNRDYQNQVPSYQGNHVPGSNAYQGHQGGGAPYQGGGAPYQGSGTGYQGGGLGGGGPYQSGGTSSQGGGQGGGGGPYQGSGTGYQGGGSGYAGGGNAFQGGGGGPYQGSGNAYPGGASGGGSGGYPGGSNTYQGGGGSFQPGGNPYQGRDMTGRD